MTMIVKFLILLFSLIIISYTSLCQVKEKRLPYDTIEPRMRVNFHFMDSIYPYTIFFTSTDFYVKNGFVDQPELGKIILYQNKTYTIEYPLLSDTPINIYSAVPRLLERDTIGTTKLSEYNFVDELYYSYILRILNEPSLYNCNNKQAIRIIRNYGGLLMSDRIEINDEGVEHVRSFVSFNGPGAFNEITTKRTQKSRKHEQRFYDIGKELRIDNEKYFSTLNLQKSYPTDRTLIEYRNVDKYYIIRTPYVNKPYSKAIRNIRNF
jgi:hypothetical protein